VHTNFHQWYECSSEKYYNLWQIYEQHQQHLIDGTKHIEYVIDPELIEVLKNFKKPRTDKKYIQSLIVDSLKKIRKKYNKVRLLYSGGTDSHTILKTAIDNDIYIDETITHMVSMEDNPKVNIEYLPGLKYANLHTQKQIGKITVIRPVIDDIAYYNDDNWYLDQSIVKGSPLWLRGQYVCRYMPKAEQGTITLTGYEKPQIINQAGQLYWSIPDNPMSEYMEVDSIYHFFCDKNNPELLVSQLYAFIDNIKTFGNLHNNIDSFGTKKRLDLINKLGYYSTGRPYLDKALIGKQTFYTSLKNRLFIKELIKLGHQSTVDLITDTHKKIFLKYYNIPHGLEYMHGFVEPVSRFSQKIAIYQDSIGS
jgi:hypothetical protein